MMQGIQLWRASGTSLREASNFLPTRTWREGRLGWSMLHLRRRGLLRKEARAQLQEQNAKSCLLLSPEDKISQRLDNYSSLFSCRYQSLPPRTEHMVCLEDGNLVDLVSKSLDLPPQFVEELVHFGAIYHALVCPPPPKGSLSPLQWELYKKAAALSHNKKRPSLKGISITEAQKAVRVASTHEGIEAGSYLRVHVHVKRFPRCYEIDWKSRVIAHTESYVVLDKPAGVPVGHSLDNIIECCVAFTSRALHLNESLRLTHQLDNCTEGCLVLAKTKEFSSEFHLLLRNREVKKYYLVLAAAPVPVGVVVHYMRPGLRHPRIVSPAPMPGWARCQLEVLDCREVAWPTSEVEERYRVQNQGWEAKDVAYECKVQLFTGRTHQVRAQFAALNAPIVGDSMYMPAIRSLLKSPEVYPFPSILDDNDDDTEVGSGNKEVNIEEKKVEEWVALHGTEPECAIGLQASEISWDDGACMYNANDPWWR